MVVTFLGSLVQSCCGEGGILQRNITGMCGECLQCVSRTGFAPTHGLCALPAHTSQALCCSAGNCPRPALGCMHLPGLSRSGSGTGVVLRGADSVGLCFVPFPGPSSSGDEVFGECSRCVPAPIPAARFSGCTTGAPSQVDVDCPEPKKSQLAKKPVAVW